jgi:tRNA threonylcarbamoyl adenosine modification protein YeaZ
MSRRTDTVPDSGAPRPLLAIEASTGFGSVAVGQAGRLLAEVGLSGPRTLSAKLIPAVNEAMRLAGVQKPDLGGVVVGGGPGSFTGIRLAGATAKGIVHALGLPLMAFSSLMVTAANAWAHGGEVCALEDARGRDVFAARYRMGAGIEVLDAPAVHTIDEVIARWGDGGGGGRDDDISVSSLSAGSGTGAAPRLLVGSGAVRHRDELIRHGMTVADELWAVPRAASLLWLASRLPAMGEVADAALWEPEYLRASGAERIAEERHAAGAAR